MPIDLNPEFGHLREFVLVKKYSH